MSKNSGYKNYGNNNNYYSKSSNNKDNNNSNEYSDSKNTTSSSTYKSPFSRTTFDLRELNDLALKNNLNHGLCGGQNLGNTCYMNSSIACLSNCHELTQYFLTKKYRSDINKSNKEGTKGRLAEAWYSLLKEYWLSKERYGVPKEIKKIVSSKNEKFEGYGQQDSNEFMTVFLELLGEDLNKATKKEYKELKEKGEGESELECAKRFWEFHLNRNDSIITDLFHGLFKNTIVCPRCKWKCITFDPFNTLNLNIPNERVLYKLRMKKEDYQDVEFFYITKFNIFDTMKIKMRVNKKDFNLKNSSLSLNQITQALKKFKLSPKKLDFMQVSNSNLDNYLDNDGPIPDGFIFAQESDVLIRNKEKACNYFPLYFHDGEFSAYPRNFNMTDSMTFAEFKKKIYFYARKYFKTSARLFKYNLIKNYSYFQDVDKELEKLNEIKPENMSEFEDNLVKLMEKEYKEVVINKNCEQFLDRFPYDIYVGFLKKREMTYASLLKYDNLRTKLSFLQISKEEDSIDILAENAYEGKIKVVLALDSKSMFCKENINLNSCLPLEDEASKVHRSSSPYPLTIFDCLDFFSSDEQLDKGNEWFCQNCKTRVSANKKIEIYYLPKILIICLNRFKNNGRYYYEKNCSFVDFPVENFELGPYVIGPDKDHSKFDLIAVSQHYGSTGGGHYTAACKNIDENWYEYDDSHLSQLSKINEIVNKAAYVLFYRKQTN